MNKTLRFRHRLRRHGPLLPLLVLACGGGEGWTAGDPKPEDDVQVGYGTQADDQVTGAISSVSGDELNRSHAANLAEALVGRVAGLEVYRRPNGEYSVRIRGATSLSGSSIEPLIVIDGRPLAPTRISSVLTSLAPADIERVDVLKDAGSAAIYGVRGANGVVVITTKRGR